MMADGTSASGGSHHRHPRDDFSDAEAHSKILDSDWREDWQHADEVVRALATRDDLKIVDLGAGTGYFATRLAKVLPNGRILALDIEQSMVKWIDDLVAKEGIKNITTKLIDPEDPKLEEVPFKFDVLLVGYTYHHMGPEEVRIPYFRDKVRPAMPDDAVVVIVDFEEFPADKPSDLVPPHGEDHEHPHLMKPEQVKADFASAGFTFVTDYDFHAKPNYMLAFKATK